MCLPERVCVACGAYSSDSGSESSEVVVLTFSSWSDRSDIFRFLEVRDSNSMSNKATKGDRGFRGPRFMPGLPRPRPFPEVRTVPSARMYVCFLLVEVFRVVDGEEVDDLAVAIELDSG